MPALQPGVRSGVCPGGGGGLGYPLERLYEEVAYIAYHFHWAPEAILELDHLGRQSWVNEIAKINERLNQAAGGPQQSYGA